MFRLATGENNIFRKSDFYVVNIARPLFKLGNIRCLRIAGRNTQITHLVTRRKSFAQVIEIADIQICATFCGRGRMVLDNGFDFNMAWARRIDLGAN